MGLSIMELRTIDKEKAKRLARKIDDTPEDYSVWDISKALVGIEKTLGKRSGEYKRIQLLLERSRCVVESGEVACPLERKAELTSCEIEKRPPSEPKAPTSFLRRARTRIMVLFGGSPSL